MSEGSRRTWIIPLQVVGTIAALTGFVFLFRATIGDTEYYDEPTPTVHEPVTITFGYWGDPGIFEAESGPSLAEQYMGTHPWVTIAPVPMDYSAHHDLLFASLAAQEEASDVMTSRSSDHEASNVMMVDEAFIAEAVGNADGFVNLLEFGAGQYRNDYLAWKWAEGANADDNDVVGLGADVGGLALCYRADLFEAVGLPSDRDEVSAAVGERWEDFIAFGEQYVDATGKRFIDNVETVYDLALRQLGTGYSYIDRDGALNMDTGKRAWDTALSVIEAGLAGGYVAWSPEWKAGFTNGDFATIACPRWMLGYIEEQIPEDFEGQWDIADIPGPGGNWGGSFYVIPNQGSMVQQQAGYNFVEWLIQPEQQLKITAETGSLPSQIPILESPEVAALTDEFFNDAPYGAIFAKSVLNLEGTMYETPESQRIRELVREGLSAIFTTLLFPEHIWIDVKEDAEEIVDEAAAAS